MPCGNEDGRASDGFLLGDDGDTDRDGWGGMDNITDGEVYGDPTGCECSYKSYDWEVRTYSNGTNLVSCTDLTATTLSYGNSGDDDDNTTTKPKKEEEVSYGACNVTSLTGTKKTTFKILLYVGSIWVILCIVAAIIINLIFRVSGHHRYIGIFKEVSIIVLFIFMGFLAAKPTKSDTFCDATTVVLHVFMLLVAAITFFEAIFARSLIRGTSFYDGSLPVALNYILPLPIALIPALIAYFLNKDDYNVGLHCFITTSENILFAFAISIWIITFAAVVMAQLAFLACQPADLRYTVEDQLFWAYKSAKAVPIMLFCIESAYFLLAFVLDTQKLWLATATKMWSKTQFDVYRPCPPKPNPMPIVPPRPPTPPPEPEPEAKSEPDPEKAEPEKPIIPPVAPQPQASAKQEEPTLPGTVPEKPAESAPVVPVVPQKPKNYSKDPTQSGDFYDWIADRNPNNVDKSEDVLFHPKPV
uniref:G_PROTEIN_RECEP_F2_4 domain-containing protein n=1 Tax=Panagrellus redivivus TaxID=6233 RepID=A0A7E4VZQ8_PANRE